MTAELATRNPQQSLKEALERIKPALEAVLPKHITADRILKVVLSATARNPSILKCSVQSICRAVMQAGELGLEIGGLLGEAYIVPYKDEAVCIPGYRGLIKLARQSGEIATISARVVYRDDDFVVDLAEETISHHPKFDGDRDDKDLTAAYCIVRYKDGGRQIDVMTRRELEKTRARSKASSNGPWVTDFPEMCRKTVTRRACKYAPVSANLQKALELEIENDAREELPDMGALAAIETEPARRIAEGIRSRRGHKTPEEEPTAKPTAPARDEADAPPPDDYPAGNPDAGP
jgi:recombination protein RecT